MRLWKMVRGVVAAWVLCSVFPGAWGQGGVQGAAQGKGSGKTAGSDHGEARSSAARGAGSFALGVDGLELQHVAAEAVTYKGRKAVRVVDAAPNGGDDTSRIAVVKGISLQDGTVELNMSGDTAANAAVNLRGFVGIAFRVNGGRYECFYLRPKNGRSEDQLQRNHSAQYISVPGYDWDKLRAETPGRYEAYVDLQPGEWTRVKVVFKGTDARLYVNGASEPTLVVHDLKQTVEAGGVALWVGPGTVAYFSGLVVR